MFSELDANLGLYQIPLDPRSAKLTTFKALFGRYYYYRLPFGITSAPEHFHARILEILTGVTGAVSLTDNVLVFSKNQEEHKHLAVALRKLQRAKLTLNKEKCYFSKDRITFLGQILMGWEFTRIQIRFHQSERLEPQKMLAIFIIF